MGVCTRYGRPYPCYLCGLRASLRVTSLSTGYGRLCGLRTSLRATSFYTRGWHRSLRATDVSAGDGRLCGRRTSLRATDVSAGDGRLCGRRTSLRATDVSAGDGRLCARRASIRVAGIALYRLQLRICQYRNADARLYGWLASLSLRTTVADLPVPQIWRASSSLQLMVGACLSRCLLCLQCSVLLCLLC
jgi:hypothetical protein